MTETKFSIASRASILVGGKPIGSFDDGTTESMVAQRLYDIRAQELLVEHDWRFAVTSVALQHLLDPPQSVWSDAWHLPADYLKLLRLTVQDRNLTSFEIHQNMVFCDVHQDQELVLDYIRQVETTWFPPYFVVVLEERLSSDFAGVLREDAALAGFHRGEAAKKLLLAKRLDRLNQPAKKFPVGRLKAQRL